MWATHFSHFCGNITMEICRLSTIVLLAIIATAILSADRISLDKHVKGYLGNDVKLGCKLLNGKLTQFQWLLVKPENTVTLLVHNPDHGLSIHETPLKGRLESAGTALDASITIKDVQMNDTGTYTCEVSSFPDGYFRGNVTLTVLDHPRPLSSGRLFATRGLVQGAWWSMQRGQKEQWTLFILTLPASGLPRTLTPSHLQITRSMQKSTQMWMSSTQAWQWVNNIM
ncbi:nectin-3-like protein isoform X3 [Esox lucius]|uniref:nectin-3-like protein isoform X3 n=1 Tax=Esox lucius TaxID=8010 RepID=UPI001476CF8F|nr:nectin-3-like protein isoform X3 [Esox lucius]